MKWALSLYLSFFAFTQVAFSAQVIWSSKRFAQNYTSAGVSSPLGEETTFQLGSFSDGFIPTPENTAEWLDHWVAAQSAPYNPTTRFFTGSFVYSENSAPFMPGNQPYIFGFDRLVQAEGSDKGEWILVTNPSWRWPIANSGIALPSQWSMSSATETILGAVDASSDAHMTTESVSLGMESLSPELWQQRYLAGRSQAEADWNADPDGDGLANLIEYFTGGVPLLRDQNKLPLYTVIEDTGQHFIEISLSKAAAATGVNVMIEVSDDLVTWTPGGNEIEMLENNDSVIRFRDKTPLGRSHRYLRVSASL